MSEKNTELTSYVEQAAQLLDLSIAPEYLPGVVDNLNKMAAIASLVTEFELPDELEAAPIFEP
ncbi:DUF4089 domain-containing protein [Candidatus Gracilibacteria bacterium]|jgi:Protein of unknown function (DUF4089)|nr:DUF4089 domain-containing protein [Candidatus Gracilibacteria bacterium]NJM86304.1 DUF4089 domain-containing protein [Hydrococcus sp. RU_2_2]NJP18118.1 DUF4089 domain-containing protein [Hydrococcus sp. CRU_1_1]